MPKRKNEDDINVDDLAEEFNSDGGLIDGLLEFDRDELAVLIAHVANEAGITTAAFKKARIDLPSFSAAKWSSIASQFGLSRNVELDNSHFSLETFTTAEYHLPPSLHEAMFKYAWRWQDVYRERIAQTNEEAHVKILDPYIVPIVALFQGRVIDKPEQAMVETKYSTGGEVGHQIFMRGGVLFLIVEYKFGTPDANPLPQLFLELLSAAEANKSTNFKGLRIYGLLTNITVFGFYSYDPSTNKFCFDTIMFCNVRRPNAFADMMDISNKIFGVVLSAYMDGLHASITHSDQTGWNTPTSSLKPLELTKEGKSTGGHKTTNQWEAALALAESCVDKFNEPVASHHDIEDRGNEAVALLTRSARSIPRASKFTGGNDDPSTMGELKVLATHIAKKRHERYLAELNPKPQ